MQLTLAPVSVPDVDDRRIHTLRDGRRAVIRAARASDRAAYVAAVGALSPQARYQRFFAPSWPLRDRDVDRLMDLESGRQRVWLAFDETERLGLGAGRYALGALAGTAEVAFAILDSWHGIGLGGALVDRVIAGARSQGIDTLVAETLEDNHGAEGVLRSRRFAMDGAARGVVGWHLRLPAADLSRC
jgi:GNAT superfamily N-acetyltransferase